MKLRHAVALALVGWYLMVPPKSGPQASLNEWVTLFSFDTASECRQADNAMLHVLEKYKPKPGASNATQAMLNSQCIATNDPRLKGN